MYDRILVATDGSAKSQVAVKHGVELAKAVGATVLGVYVVNEVVVASAVRQLGADKKEIEAKLQAGGEKAVAEIKKMADDAGVPVETMVRFGAPANMIVDLARTEGADLVVMGSHGESGVTKLLIGSVVQKVLYWATCPVLVVR
jgi:nucleotide-binding universal stress UspA family protein